MECLDGGDFIGRTTDVAGVPLPGSLFLTRVNGGRAERIKPLHLAQHTELQLALIDVVLGDEDGITCVQRTKDIRPQTRIILISAYPDREFHCQGLQSGAVAFLDKKNLDLSTLRHVIDDVFT